MKYNNKTYKRLGDYIEQVNVRNSELLDVPLLGINIDKHFMPSVANIIGTDLSRYKLVHRNQFACNRMHVGRDNRIPIAISESDTPFMVSPAYDVFRIIDESLLNPHYLMMWFQRKEFDRECTFYTDADVRLGLPRDSFEDLRIKIPSIEEQQKIVSEYQAIENKIKVNEQICEKLEDTAQAIYREWFVEFNFPDENGKPYKDNGGKMVWNEELEKDVPEGWEVTTIGNYANVKSGFAFKSAWWESKGVPVIKIGSINNNSIDINSLDYVDVKNAELAKDYVVRKADLVIAMTGATIGKIGIIPDLGADALVNQRVGVFNLGNNPIRRAPYLYFTLLSDYAQNEIKSVGGDSAQANISNKQIDDIKIILPVNFENNMFNIIGLNIIEEILIKKKENFRLAELKSLLLASMTK